MKDNRVEFFLSFAQWGALAADGGILAIDIRDGNLLGATLASASVGFISACILWTFVGTRYSTAHELFKEIEDLYKKQRDLTDILCGVLAERDRLYRELRAHEQGDSLQ